MAEPLSLKLDPQGLIPCVVQDATSREILMVAYMNEESLDRTQSTGRATYWSRSRSSFWVKGESSGHFQTVREIRVDCDLDCLLILVDQTGPACHTGQRSCFYRKVEDGQLVPVED